MPSIEEGTQTTISSNTWNWNDKKILYLMVFAFVALCFDRCFSTTYSWNSAQLRSILVHQRDPCVPTATGPKTSSKNALFRRKTLLLATSKSYFFIFILLQIITSRSQIIHLLLKLYYVIAIWL